MATEYIPIYDENGNTIDPTAYVQGMARVAGEFNSGLDRENFPNATLGLTGQTTSEDVFTSMTPFTSSTNFSPDMSDTGRQGGTGNDASGILYQAVTVTQDCHIDVYWSAQLYWSGTYSATSSGTRPDREDTIDTVTIIASISGIELFTLGPFDDGAEYLPVAGCGSAQLPSGTYYLKVECVVQRLCGQNGHSAGACTNSLTVQQRCGVALAQYR